MINGYGCYLKYISLKSHFNSESYDYFKYGSGFTKANLNSYNKRTDKYFFEKLSKKLQTEKNVEEFLVANLVYEGNLWIGDSFNEKYQDNYLQWKRITQSISYIFKQDLDKIISYIEKNSLKIEDIFFVKDSRYPILLKLLTEKEINLETFVLMNYILQFLKLWNRKISDTIIWPNIYLKCIKYEPFLIDLVNIKNIKNILKNKFVCDKRE